ncbi:hypothetical protein [Pedobacter agri]|uniref:hypothetical protein n=1 Tax=Pedobacter agri TaxID=454586 RepID=UPI00029A0451|nr:hypothetical protein [Pedobacter agri]
MKPLKLLFLLIIFAGVVNAQGVKFSPEKPAAGSKVTFTYQPKGTNLQNLTDIKCSSYTFFFFGQSKGCKNRVGKGWRIIQRGDHYL